MSITNIVSAPEISRRLEGQVTKKDLQEIKEYLQQLTDELRYELTHVDESNMTQEIVNTIQQGADTSALGTSGIQRFVAGLKLKGSASSDRLYISLHSNGIDLGSLNLGLTQSQDYLIDKIYPVGSIYCTTSEDDPADILGIGTWTDITPEGNTYKIYERSEDSE